MTIVEGIIFRLRRTDENFVCFCLENTENDTLLFDLVVIYKALCFDVVQGHPMRLELTRVGLLV